jgi:hypothetical protein
VHASIVATYVFIAFTSSTTIIPLEPYALNVEFQHFIPMVFFHFSKVVNGATCGNLKMLICLTTNLGGN